MSHSNDAVIAEIVARLLNHFGTSDEPLSVRKAIARDWVEDLAEFTVPQVTWACREWRRTQSVRPTIAEIRRLACQAEHHDLERLALTDDRQRWPKWLEDIWGPEPEGPRKRAEQWGERAAAGNKNHAG